MKKFLFVATALVSAFSLTTVSFAQKNFVAKDKTKTARTAKASVNSLLASLPASDAIMFFDMKRMMAEALPQMLATKPQTLAMVNGKLDQFKEKTGIDPRQFEQIAVGIGYKKVSATETDFEPLILARGKFESGAFLGLAKVAAEGKYREEKIGNRSVYIFSAKELLEDANAPKSNDWFNKLLKSMTGEIAVTDFDGNTLAIGKLNRIKTAFGTTRSAVRPDLLSLVAKKQSAIFSFAGSMPQGFSQFIDMDNDEIGKNINAVRKLYGSLDLADGKGVLSVAAKTMTVGEAQSLEDMLAGLQMVGKGFLGGARGADKQVYSRMIENAVIARTGSEVTVDLAIPKSDIDILMGVLIKEK